MEVRRIITGAFETNSYIIASDNGYILIDPSGKASKIISILDKEVKAILLTHGHFDHIKAVDELYDLYHCPIYLFNEDRELVDKKMAKNTNILGIFTAHIKSPIVDLKEGILEIDGIKFEVYHTPGHTNGSAIFKLENVLFTGDTLFKESVGRTDLYGGSDTKLKDSLRIFKDFDNDILVYPGHGDFSDIDHELMYNKYLNF